MPPGGESCVRCTDTKRSWAGMLCAGGRSAGATRGVGESPHVPALCLNGRL